MTRSSTAAPRPDLPDGEPALEALDRDLWVATRPLRLAVGDVGARMTVVRLASGDLVLHSPVPLDAALRRALDAVGRVRWLVGPSKLHHFYLGEYLAAYPGAELCGAPGLAAKRRDLAFAHVADEDTAGRLWHGELRAHVFQGAPIMNEVVLFHPASRTLILTDLAFNVRSRNRARLFHRLVGATGRFGPHRIVRAGIRDKAAARLSRDAILAWDFDRVVVSHGDVLERGGHAAMREAFAYLGPPEAAAAKPSAGGRLLDYVVLIVADLDRALAFYTGTLGFELQHRAAHYAQMHAGTTRLSLYTREAMAETLGEPLAVPSPTAPAFELGFKVADCDAAFAELVAAGAQAVTPPTTRPWGQRTAYVRDPDGNLVELAQDLGR